MPAGTIPPSGKPSPLCRSRDRGWRAGRTAPRGRIHQAFSVRQLQGGQLVAHFRGDARLDPPFQIEGPDVGRPNLRPGAGREDSPTVRRDREGPVSAGRTHGPHLAAGPVDPHESADLVAVLIGENAGTRQRERRGERRRVVSDMVGDRERVSRQASGLPVEPLSQERALPAKHQISGIAILDGRDHRHEDAMLLSRLGQHQVSRVLAKPGEIDKALSVGQEPRPDQTELAARRIGSDDLGRLASRGGDPVDGLALNAREKDVAAAAPGPRLVASGRNIADRDGRTAREVHAFELGPGEEADRSAVRGPEER